MAMKALDKIVFGTAWGGLDVLVVDMPPGAAPVLSALCKGLCGSRRPRDDSWDFSWPAPPMRTAAFPRPASPPPLFLLPAWEEVV